MGVYTESNFAVCNAEIKLNVIKPTVETIAIGNVFKALPILLYPNEVYFCLHKNFMIILL